MKTKYSNLKKFFRWLLVLVISLLLMAILSFYFKPLQTIIAVQKGCLRLNGIQSRYANINGNTIHFFVGGHGPFLLLLHGHPGKAVEWTPILPLLAKNHRIIAMDFLGYGDSDAPHTNYSIALQKQMTLGLLKYLHVDKTVVLGFSMGGWVALILAAENPEIISRLVIIDSGGFPLPSSLTPELLTPETLDEFKHLEIIEGGEPLPDFLVKDYIKNHRDRSYVMKSMVHSLLSTNELMDGRLKGINSPALIVWAKDDHLIPFSIAEKIHEQLPRSEVKLYENCGHLILWNCTQRVLPDILNFIDKP